MKRQPDPQGISGQGEQIAPGATPRLSRWLFLEPFDRGLFPRGSGHWIKHRGGPRVPRSQGEIDRRVSGVISVGGQLVRHPYEPEDRPQPALVDGRLDQFPRSRVLLGAVSARRGGDQHLALGLVAHDRVPHAVGSIGCAWIIGDVVRQAEQEEHLLVQQVPGPEDLSHVSRVFAKGGANLYGDGTRDDEGLSRHGRSPQGRRQATRSRSRGTVQPPCRQAGEHPAQAAQGAKVWR